MRVLITGASSGIGKSLALQFADIGYDLVLVSRDYEKLLAVKTLIGDKVNVNIYSSDLGNVDNCKSLYNKYRDIDILVNNAGMGKFGEFSDTYINDEIDMININVIALHCLMKLYLNDMIKRDSGYILNVASIAGFMPGPLMSTYYATKNYVVRLSEGVREELKHKKSNVRISVLCPGPVRTNFDNVAGVKFSLKGKESDMVSKYAIDKMFKDKFYIVPGIDIKILKIISDILPSWLIAKFVYFQQKKKKL